MLKVISSSPGDLQPVFNVMLESATELCGAEFGTLSLYDGEEFRNVALHNLPKGIAETRLRERFRPHPKSGMAYVADTKTVAHIEDLRAQPPYLEGDPAVVAIADLGGARTILIVPMLKEERLVGAITIFRQEVRPFTEKQIELVKNFAAQAVIAIENRACSTNCASVPTIFPSRWSSRPRLRRCSRSSQVRRATSSRCSRRCSKTQCASAMPSSGISALYDGREMRMAAMHNAPPAFAELRRRESDQLPPGSVDDSHPRNKKECICTIADLTAQEPLASSALVKIAGARTAIGVPMLKDDELVGAIVIYRTERRAFADKQIALLTNFAAQAVIAIENARLLNELRESLQRQTATSDVLSVISSSPGELGPVFNTMLENATRICDAEFGSLVLFEGNNYRRRWTLQRAGGLYRSNGARIRLCRFRHRFT